jgi:hypothetical protein
MQKAFEESVQPKAYEDAFPALDDKIDPVEEAKDSEPVEDKNSDIDDERTGGEWVTTENLYKHISKGDAQALIPSDFALGKETE